MHTVFRAPTCFAVLVIAAAACGADDGSGTTSASGGTTVTGPSGGMGGTTSSGATGGTTSSGGGMGGTPSGGGMGVTVIRDTGDDQCPGDAYVLTPGTKLLLLGDTSTATDQHQQSLCTNSQVNGPDRVYDLTFDGTGSAWIEVRSSGGGSGGSLNPTLVMQTADMCNDSEAGSAGCFASFESHEGYAFEVTTPTQLYAIVDSALGTSGLYELEVEFAAGVCGDGVTNYSLGETCDDADAVNDDGCDASCEYEMTAAFDTCDGEPVLLPSLGSTIVLSDGNWGYTDQYTAPSCGPNVVPGSGGRDRVHEVVVGQAGTLTASIGHDATGTINYCESEGLSSPFCWDAVLYALGPDVCEIGGQPGQQLACSDNALFGPEQIQLQVEPGVEYYVVVDGRSGFPTGFGAYHLRLQLQ